MGLSEKNQKVLWERFPHLKEHFNDRDAAFSLDGEDIEGRHVMYLKAGENIVQLDSLYDMESLLNLWCQSIQPLAMYSKVVLFGFGNGSMLRTLLNKLDSSHKVIVYEPDFTVMSYSMEHFDLTDIFSDERFDLIVRSAINGSISEEFTKRLEYSDIETFRYYVYPNYNHVFTVEYLEYIHEFETACNSINSSQSVMGRYNEQNFGNTFANINSFLKSKSVENLYSRLPHDIPAIIVASGPSLDKNVELLKEAKNKAFIIAVDSSLRSVLKTGVMPDVCVTIDPKKLSKHFSDDRANDVPMFCYIRSNPEILSNHRADKFFLNDLNHHVQHFFSRHTMVFPVVSTGGSVANNAFSIAHMLGFNKIILIGQDLAYTDNRTHSASSVRGEWNIDASTLDQVITESIDGAPIASSGEFTLYRTWIEEQIRNYPDTEVIDATEGGAKIYGSEIMTFKEAIDKYCDKEYDLAGIIAETDRFMNDAVAEEFVAYIKGIPNELDGCLKETLEGIRTYEQMLKLIYSDKYHSAGFKNGFEKTKEINKYLDKAPVMEYVKNEIQNETNELLKTVYQGKDDERSELICACNMGIDYLNVMKRGIEKVKAQTEPIVSEIKFN